MQKLASIFLLVVTVVCTTAGQQNPDAMKIYNEANAQYKAGRYARALLLYDSALAIRNHEFICYQKGLTHRKLLDEKKAIDAFREAVRLNPKFAAGYNALGTGFFALREFDSSIVYYERALKENAKLEPARKGLASALTAKSAAMLAQGEIKSAVALAQKALAGDRAAYQANLILAQAYNRDGNFQEAIKAAQAALKYPKTRGAASFEIGLAYRNLGDKVKAREAFLEAQKDTTYRRNVQSELQLLSR